MKKNVIKTILFIIISILFASFFVSRCYIREKTISLSVCGGSNVEILEHYSSDYKDNHRKRYVAGQSVKTLVYPLKKETSFNGHRFDFGYTPGATFLITKLIYAKPGFYSYEIDLSRCKEWIKTAEQIKKIAPLDGMILVETDGNDGRFYTGNNMIEKYGIPRLNYSLKGIFYFIFLEVLLLLLLFWGKPFLSHVTMFLNKNSFRKSLVHNLFVFAGINIFILLPLVYFLCRNIPNEFVVQLKSAKNAYIQFITSDYSRTWTIPYSKVNQYQNISISLPKQIDPSTLRIDFGYRPQQFEISEIYVRKFPFFKRVLRLKNAGSVYEGMRHIKSFICSNDSIKLDVNGNDGHIVPTPENFNKNLFLTIEMNALFFALLLAELMLFFSFYITKCDKERKIFSKINLQNSALTAFTCSIFLTVIIPFQSYLANKNLFNFVWTSLFSECIVLLCILFTVLFAILLLSRRLFANHLHIFILSITFYFFLESGVLSIGLPQLDGYIDNYLSLSRSVIDTSVLLVILLLPYLFYRFLYKSVVWIALAILILAGASLLDVKKSEVNDSMEGYIISSKMLRSDVVSSAKYSPDSNVILLIVDSITSQVVQDVFKSTPSLLSKFNGFVNYTNNIGMHAQTSVGIPGLMTGDYFTGSLQLPSYTESIFKANSFIKPWLDKQYPIFINIALNEKTAYTNAAQVKSKTQKVQEAALRWRMYGLLQWNMIELSLFRLTPYYFKRAALKQIIENWQKGPVKKNLSNDLVLYTLLGSVPTDKTYKKSLHLHHSTGAHPPFIYGANGERYNFLETNYVNYKNQSTYVFKLLGKLMDCYKKLGIYDTSTIIICGDHGLQVVNHEQLPGPAFPALLVKAAGAKNNFKEVNIPTSHSKIATMVRRLVNENLTGEQITQILYQKNRLYREIRQNKIYDWLVAEDKSYKLVIKNDDEFQDPGKMKPLKVNKKYLFRSFDNPDYPDFIVKNGSRTSGMGLDYSSGILSLTFKVPVRKQPYEVTIGVVPYNSPKLTLSFKLGTSSASKEQSFEQNGLVPIPALFKDVKPDKNGILHINIHNPAPKKGELTVLHSILIR